MYMFNPPKYFQKIHFQIYVSIDWYKEIDWYINYKQLTNKSFKQLFCSVWYNLCIAGAYTVVYFMAAET